MTERAFGILAFILIVTSTLVVFSGMDLVLPAIPDFPRIFNTSIAMSQMVLAAYTAGSVLGLLLFGALGARYDRCMLMSTSLAIFAASSWACTLTTDIDILLLMRVIQGISSAASGVFAPSVIKTIFDERHAVKAIGLMGSIESLMPAFAPILGAWLLNHYGWKSSFDITAALGAVMACAFFLLRSRLPMGTQLAGAGTYTAIFKSPVFLRYAISHACSLGGLVVIVFAAPAVIVNTMGGTLTDFIAMQVIGIFLFITSANFSAPMARRFGAERVIVFGSALAALAAVIMLVYALLGGNNPHLLVVLMLPMNIGFGLRGPNGYFAAIQAAKGDDTRGAALTILAILVAIAGGTAIAAPFLEYGLWALMTVSVAIHLAGLLVLWKLPKAG